MLRSMNLRWLGLVVVTTVGLAITGASRAGAPIPTFADYVGTYDGEWFNSTFGSSAPAHIRIAVDGTTATLGVDLDSGANGSVFGLGFDPPEVVFTGTLGAHALSKQSDSLFGDVYCNGNPSNFQCTANLINANVLSGSIAGGINGGILSSTYQLNLADFSMAQGSLTATKVPEPVMGVGATVLGALAVVARRRKRCAV
jgi:hypothetical protein